MGKRNTSTGRRRPSKSHKTKKRLEAKRIMLEAKKKKHPSKK